MNYYSMKRMNAQVEALRREGRLEAHLKELHQQMAFTIDQTLDGYERGTKIADYRQVLMDYCEGKVLETCVGSGRNGKYYAAGTDVTFLDWSPNMIEVALTKHYPFIKSRFVVQNVKNMEFPDDSFDTVVDTFGLEYVENPQIAIKQMRRVCRPGGRILLLEHGMPTLIQTHKFYDLRAAVELLRNGSRSNNHWHKMIEAEGFEIERHERKVNGTIYFYVLINNKSRQIEKL